MWRRIVQYSLLGLFVSFTSGSLHAEGRPFITKWQGKAGVPIKIPILGTYSITWYNEATPTDRHTTEYTLTIEKDQLLNPPYTLTPPSDGIYVVEAGPEGVGAIAMKSINRDIIYGSPEALLEVVQFGTVKWRNMQSAFAGCKNMRFAESIDKPNLEDVGSLWSMFDECTSFNSSLNDWDVSHVNGMGYMFNQCSSFNQPLDKWVVSNVQYMTSMFAGCVAFNQPLETWDVSQVSNIDELFSGCSSFNQPLNNWNVSNITSMLGVFERCSTFNQPLDRWDVRKVYRMPEMFSGCTQFNQPLDSWDVSRVEEMASMFEGCTNFNQPLNTWNISQVSRMNDLFQGCTAFNQPLDNWDVSKVTDMYGIFIYCSSFNQNLGTWKLKNCSKLSLSNSGLDTENYSKTLAGWAAQPDIAENRSIEAGGLRYVWKEPRNRLEVKGWDIIGDTYDPSYVNLHIHPDRLTLKQDSKAQLRAEVIVSEGGDQGVTWTSNQPQIVSVDPATGWIHAKAIGSATISAVSKADPTHTASCEVTVPAAGVESVTVTPAELMLNAKETQKLQAQVQTYGIGVDKVVTWSSSNPSIAHVDAKTGMVTTVAPGEVKIIATSRADETKQGECLLTVAGVRSVAIEAAGDSQMKPGEVKKFTATVVAFGNVDRGVRWLNRYEGNDEAAKVDPETGEVTALRTGHYWLRVTSKADDTKNDYHSILIEGVTGIHLEPNSPELLRVGETIERRLSVDANGYNIDRTASIANSNPQVIRITQQDEQLKFEALAKGEATITITSNADPTKFLTFKITVIEENGVQIFLTQPSLSKGTKITLKARVEGTDQRVTWSSSDPKCIEINAETGEATAIEVGEVIITARSLADPSKLAECKLSVRGVRSISFLDLAETEIPVNGTKRLTVQVEKFGDIWGDVDWNIEDETILKRESYGYRTATFTGLRPGISAVTATSNFDHEISASCKLTVTGVREIKLNETELIISKQDKKHLTTEVVVFGNVDRGVTWSSSDPEVAEVYDLRLR